MLHSSLFALLPHSTATLNTTATALLQLLLTSYRSIPGIQSTYTYTSKHAMHIAHDNLSVDANREDGEQAQRAAAEFRWP